MRSFFDLFESISSFLIESRADKTDFWNDNLDSEENSDPKNWIKRQFESDSSQNLGRNFYQSAKHMILIRFSGLKKYKLRYSSKYCKPVYMGTFVSGNQ